jgi:hypothetical protein
MTDAAEPDGRSPGGGPDPLEPDLDQGKARHARLGKAWAAAAVSAWAATAIIALTVGGPQLARVQHIVQQSTGMSAIPPLIPGIPLAPAPSSTPPSHGLASSPTVQDGAVTRPGTVPRIGASAPGAGEPGAQPPPPSSPGAGYTVPAATQSVPVTTTPPATVPPSAPTATPTTVPAPTPTPGPTAEPTATPTPDPGSTPAAAASCLSAAAGSSSVASVLGALASCTPDLPVP